MPGGYVGILADSRRGCERGGRSGDDPTPTCPFKRPRFIDLAVAELLVFVIAVLFGLLFGEIAVGASPVLIVFGGHRWLHDVRAALCRYCPDGNNSPQS